MAVKATAVKAVKRRAQAGITLLETILGLGILGVALIGVVQYQAQQASELRTITAANQLRTVQQALDRMLADYYSEIVNDITDGNSADNADFASQTNYDFQEALEDQGYLPAAMFRDAGGGRALRLNPYGQSYSVEVANDGNQLIGLVATAQRSDSASATTSTRIPLQQRNRIANLVGGSGAVIEIDNSRIPNGAPNTNRAVIGAYGNFIEDLTNFGSANSQTVNGEPNGVAALSFVGQDTILTDQLYRVDIGIPEANSMFTDLYMRDNSIQFFDPDSDVSRVYVYGDDTNFFIHDDDTSDDSSALASFSPSADEVRFNAGQVEVYDTTSQLRVSTNLNDANTANRYTARFSDSTGNNSLQIDAAGTVTVRNDTFEFRDNTVNHSFNIAPNGTVTVRNDQFQFLDNANNQSFNIANTGTVTVRNDTFEFRDNDGNQSFSVSPTGTVTVREDTFEFRDNTNNQSFNIDPSGAITARRETVQFRDSNDVQAVVFDPNRGGGRRFAVYGTNANNYFSVLPSGDVEIGAPGGSLLSVTGSGTHNSSYHTRFYRTSSFSGTPMLDANPENGRVTFSNTQDVFFANTPTGEPNVTLDQLLPRQIAMQSFLAGNGASVPRPACHSSMTPRIFLSPLSMNTSPSYNNGDSFGAAARRQIATYSVTVPTNSSGGLSTVTIPVFDNYGYANWRAYASGSGPWTVNVLSTNQHNGNATVTGGIVIAQTYCERS